jgi:hypothetical protein
VIAIAGTVPVADFPLTEGEITLDRDGLRVGPDRIPVKRGTPALCAAAAKTLAFLGQGPAYVFLAGDIGKGNGSRGLYARLESKLPSRTFSVLTFHYLLPDVDWHNRVLFAIGSMRERPTLIADAGFMYAAKMSGQAEQYDLFTPDAGELAFLADEQAPHPFYTRGFILHEENKIPDLISRAYAHENAARLLLVKGEEDYIADREGIRYRFQEHACEALEAIGGTGDTLTGIVTALAGSGFSLEKACAHGIAANRLAGKMASPDPSTQIEAIIHHIPEALRRVV